MGKEAFAIVIYVSPKNYVNNTCYIIANSNKYMLSVLNSQPIKYYISLIAASLGEGAFRWFKQYVERLPVPMISAEEQESYIALVDKILAAKEKDSSADISQWQREIDNLVYELYGLTKEEIEMVEGIAG